MHIFVKRIRLPGTDTDTGWVRTHRLYLLLNGTYYPLRLFTVLCVHSYSIKQDYCSDAINKVEK
jgi:hypothetical protein